MRKNEHLWKKLNYFSNFKKEILTAIRCLKGNKINGNGKAFDVLLIRIAYIIFDFASKPSYFG